MALEKETFKRYLTDKELKPGDKLWNAVDFLERSQQLL
jgi:hypothetical protein